MTSCGSAGGRRSPLGNWLLERREGSTRLPPSFWRAVLRETMASLLAVLLTAAVCWALWGFFGAGVVWAAFVLAALSAARRVVLWLLP